MKSWRVMVRHLGAGRAAPTHATITITSAAISTRPGAV